MVRVPGHRAGGEKSPAASKQEGVAFPLTMASLTDLMGCPGIVAARAQMERLLRHPTDARRLPPILIEGETGTGKGLLARAIHRAGTGPLSSPVGGSRSARTRGIRTLSVGPCALSGGSREQATS